MFCRGGKRLVCVCLTRMRWFIVKRWVICMVAVCVLVEGCGLCHTDSSLYFHLLMRMSPNIII